MSQSSSSKKYVNNTSWILLEKMSRIISGLLVGVLVARFLGPDQFGIISYALNVVAIFTIFSTLGLDSIIVREILIRKHDLNSIMGSAFLMRFFGSLLVVGMTIIYSSMRDSHDQTFIVFIVSLAIVMQSVTVVDFYFQSQALGKFTAINQVITLLISAVIKLLLIYTKAPLIYFASMVFLEAFLTAIIQMILYQKQGLKLFNWKFSFQESKILLLHSWPIIISGLMLMVYQKMDQIFIKRLLDLHSLGNYAAAIRISEASYFIPVAISAAIFPGIVNIRNNTELQAKRLTQFYSILIWAALIISIGGWAFGDYVIHLLYKNGYEIAPSIFKILVWNTLPVFLGTAWSVWIISENKQKLNIIICFVSLILGYFLQIYFIKRFGITGAAYAVIIANYLGFFFSISLYKPKFSLNLFIKALNPMNLISVYHYKKYGK